MNLQVHTSIWPGWGLGFLKKDKSTSSLYLFGFGCVCLVFRRSHGRLNGLLNRFAEERHSLPGSPLVQSGRSRKESLTGDARRLYGLKSCLRLRAPEDSTCLWGLGSEFTLPRLLSFPISNSPVFPCGLFSFPFSVTWTMESQTREFDFAVERAIFCAKR